MAEYRIPELPPGFVDVSFPAFNGRTSAFEVSWNKDMSHLVVDVAVNGFARMATPKSEVWTWKQQFPSVQDAIDVVVARLWLGEFT